MITAARIQRLPQVLADAIAAGEVIERPASVVKELVENALDAGARRVDVDVDGGGLVRIQVVDDGGGISSDDLELAVTRHATSKIASSDDLAAIRTLGFRGEALASVAAVSDLRIVSRTVADEDAHSIRVRGGEVLERSSAAAGPGTCVEVCELFAATPARLRFLRATATEAAAAVRVAADLALSRPEIALTCHTDGRTTLRSPGGTLRDALAAVFGARTERDLVDVHAAGELAVAGAISAPHAHRAARSGIVLVVNGRRVHNRSLTVAVEEAYRGLLPQGRHPFGVIALSLDLASIDVNVHPTKREVRFRDERAVFAAVQRACWEAVRAAPVASFPVLATRGWLQAPAPRGLSLADREDEPLPPHAREDDGDGEAERSLPGQASPPAGSSLTLPDLAPLRALGQSDASWMVASGGGSVVLVDPHAAHEKVLYTEILQAWASPAAADTQLLLVPALVECDARRMDTWERHAGLLAGCGFEVEQFGPSLLRCTGVPSLGGPADAAAVVADLLDALADGDATVDGRSHRMAAVVACHSAVRFGDRLDPAAQQRLLDRLVATPGGMTCPHGRPTVLVLGDADLRRAFRRPLG